MGCARVRVHGIDLPAAIIYDEMCRQRPNVYTVVTIAVTDSNSNGGNSGNSNRSCNNSSDSGSNSNGGNNGNSNIITLVKLKVVMT